jgi:hypothetical protein
LKAEREKCQFAYKVKHLRTNSDLSAQTLKSRKEENYIIQALKGNNCQSRISYTIKLPFNFDGEINNIQDKEKLKQFMFTKPALGLFHTEE